MGTTDFYKAGGLIQDDDDDDDDDDKSKISDLFKIYLLDKAYNISFLDKTPTGGPPSTTPFDKAGGLLNDDDDDDPEGKKSMNETFETKLSF